MLRKLNVKMLILIDEQKNIHLVGAINELITDRNHICSSILHK
jgi:hypothetical protein